MTRNTLLIFLTLIFLTACKKTDADKSIVFTTDFFMNPSQPRFGIEIAGDTMFYCEEKFEKIGTYDYYYCIYDKDSISKVYDVISKGFTTEFTTIPSIDDATLCHLKIVDGPNLHQYTFYHEELDSAQTKALNILLALKNCNLKKMQFHRFPEILLKSKLPPPPDHVQ